jgi:protein-tyrosine phosphatase
VRAELYTVEYNGLGALSIMARPRGGDWLSDEIQAWRGAGVSMVVSLLTPEEQAELELDEEATLCQRTNLAFRAFPIPNRGVPQLAEAERLITEIVEAMNAGQHVAIHCRMGIGRSAMIAAAALVALGETSEDALARIQAARRLPVPDTPEQAQWIAQYATFRQCRAKSAQQRNSLPGLGV